MCVGLYVSIFSVINMYSGYLRRSTDGRGEGTTVRIILGIIVAFDFYGHRLESCSMSSCEA